MTMEGKIKMTYAGSMKGIVGRVKEWLNEDSKLYTRICEEPTKRITVIRVNLISVMMILGILCCEQHLLVSICSMLAAGYLVARLK